jgi:hypothetical protein
MRLRIFLHGRSAPLTFRPVESGGFFSHPPPSEKRRSKNTALSFFTVFRVRLFAADSSAISLASERLLLVAVSHVLFAPECGSGTNLGCGGARARAFVCVRISGSRRPRYVKRNYPVKFRSAGMRGSCQPSFV